MKKLLLLLPFWLLATSALAADEMLYNPGFEDSSSTFLGTSFDSWSATGLTLSTETSDKVEGEQALKVTKATRDESYLYQEIEGPFESGATYRLRTNTRY